MKQYTYSNEKIAVSFDGRKCCHAAHCFKQLPAIFDGDVEPSSLTMHQLTKSYALLNSAHQAL